VGTNSHLRAGIGLDNALLPPTQRFNIVGIQVGQDPTGSPRSASTARPGRLVLRPREQSVRWTP